MLRVSDEVVDILRRGGKSCKRFLEHVARDQRAITNIGIHYHMRVRGVDVGNERGREEPMYNFSDSLGWYNSLGLRRSVVK